MTMNVTAHDTAGGFRNEMVGGVIGDAHDGAEGGDPACWLDRVCDACGRLVDERPPPDRCPQCGAELRDEERKGRA